MYTFEFENLTKCYGHEVVDDDHGRAKIGERQYSSRTPSTLESVGLTHTADRHVGGYLSGMRQRRL